MASGDVLGNDTDAIITAPGAGGGPNIKVFDSDDIQERAGFFFFLANVTVDPVTSFFAGDLSDRGGVNIAAGDIDGDGTDEVIASSAGDGPSLLRTYSGSGGQLSTLTIPVDPTPVTGQSLTTGGLFGNPQSGSGILLTPAQPPDSLVSGIPGPNFIGTAGQFGTASQGTNLAGVARGGVTIGTVDWNGDGIDDVITGAGPGNAPRVRVLDVSGGETPVELESFLAFESSFLGGVFVNG